MQARAIESGAQIGDVVDQYRRQIGVEQRRRHARPFANARQHFAGERDVGLRKVRADQRPRALLVRGVHVGVQVADRDRDDARLLQFRGGVANRLLVERFEFGACVIDAARDLARETLRGDRDRLLVEVVERIAVARLRLHFLDGAKAAIDQQADLCAAQFEQRVGGDGGAVGEEFDGGKVDAARGVLGDAVQHPDRRVRRRRRHLLDRDRAVGRIEQDKVGVGAADVDTQSVTAGHGQCV